MTTQIAVVRAHEPADVERIITAAISIADSHERTEREWIAVFEQACSLLGARFPVTQESTALPWLDPLHSARA